MKFKVKNLLEMRSLVKRMSELLKYGDVITLDGDLGAGKTTMVQLFGEYLNIEEDITSPSFSLIHWYPHDPFDVYHVDLYRLEKPENLETIDMDSFLYPDGISFIEWAQRGQQYLPKNRISIEITKGKGEERFVDLKEDSKRSKEWVKELS